MEPVKFTERELATIHACLGEVRRQLMRDEPTDPDVSRIEQIRDKLAAWEQELEQAGRLVDG